MLFRSHVVAFVDSNPVHHGKPLLGIPIVSPVEITGRVEPIVITTTLHQESVATQIRDMGLPNDIVFLA